MKQKIALVIGATGQDGSYMSKLLIDRNYIVFGTTRDTLSANLSNLKLLKIDKEVKLLKTSTSDFRSLVFTLQQVNPDEIYHLGGQNGVGLSFQFPFESVESEKGFKNHSPSEHPPKWTNQWNSETEQRYQKRTIVSS